MTAFPGGRFQWPPTPVLLSHGADDPLVPVNETAWVVSASGSATWEEQIETEAP